MIYYKYVGIPQVSSLALFFVLSIYGRYLLTWRSRGIIESHPGIGLLLRVLARWFVGITIALGKNEEMYNKKEAIKDIPSTG